MTIFKIFSIIAATLTLAIPARAADIGSALGAAAARATTEDNIEETDKLQDAVADSDLSHGAVYEMAHALFGRIPSTLIKVDANIRGWDLEPAPESGEVDIASIVEKADERFYYYNNAIPPPELVTAHKYVHLLRDSQKVDFTSTMDEHQMGEYAYMPKKIELGFVTMNMVLKEVAKIVGRAFILPTLYHEAGHARDHMQGASDPDEVINKEINSSLTEYYLLGLIDPYGERLVYLRAMLMNEVKNRPTALKRSALAYLIHLAELRETGGDRDKLRDFVKRRGYRDGHHDAPSSTRS